LVQSLQTSKLVADTDKTTDEPKIKIKVNQDELKKALKIIRLQILILLQIYK